VNRNNLRHPYLLVDFDPAEAEVDRSAAAMLDWDVTSCPAENEECGNYNEVSRLCLRKNLGATLNSKIGKLKESFALLLHPTGSQETIDLTVQMFSCSSCQKVSYQCNGKKCDKFVSSIDVTAQDLVNPSDIAVRSQKTRIEYLPVGEKQENDVLNRFIDFEYTVKLTGETPVEEGDMKVKIDFPTTVQKYKASDYFKNPCETNTIKSQIMDIKCVDFNSKNGFSLEASSNTKVTKTARKEMKIEVRLEGVDGDSCPPSDLVLNMTVTTTVDHKFYSEPQKFNSERQQFFLESKCQTVTQAGVMEWTIIGVTAAFVLGGIIWCIVRKSRSPRPPSQTADVQENAAQQNKKTIQETTHYSSANRTLNSMSESFPPVPAKRGVSKTEYTTHDTPAQNLYDAPA